MLDVEQRLSQLAQTDIELRAAQIASRKELKVSKTDSSLNPALMTPTTKCENSLFTRPQDFTGGILNVNQQNGSPSVQDLFAADFNLSDALQCLESLDDERHNRGEFRRSRTDPQSDQRGFLNQGTANLNQASIIGNSNFVSARLKKISSAKCSPQLPKPKHLISKKPRPNRSGMTFNRSQRHTPLVSNSSSTFDIPYDAVVLEDKTPVNVAQLPVIPSVYDTEEL